MARRQPRLDLLHIEATAAALELADSVWLSRQPIEDVLPGVLDHEEIRRRIQELDG